LSIDTIDIILHDDGHFLNFNTKILHATGEINKRNIAVYTIYKIFRKIQMWLSALPYPNAPRFEYGNHILPNVSDSSQTGSYLKSAKHNNTAKLGITFEFDLSKGFVNRVNSSWE
jgi:hypothetical protein